MRKLSSLFLLSALLLVYQSAFSQTPPPPPPPGLTTCTIAIAPLSDSSCTGITLPLTTTESVSGSDLIYDGVSDQFVEIPNRSAWTSYDTALTISAWINLVNTNTNQAIVSFLTAALNDGFVMRVQNGELYADVYDSTGTDHTFAGVGSIPSGVWTQIAISYQSNDSMIAYVNGIEVASQAVGPVRIAYNNGFMTFGVASWDQVSDQADGQIDEVRMYDIALNPAQMAATYNVSQSGYVTPGVIGYWRFDEGAGSVTLDATPNASDGNLINSPHWNTPSTVPLIFPVTYQWTPVSGLSDTTSADPVATVSSTTKYIVTLTDSTTRCSAKDSITIRILSTPVQVTASAGVICYGDTVTLSAYGFRSLTWNPGGAGTDSLEVSPLLSEIYILNGIDSGGCPHMDTLYIGVHPHIAISATATPQFICHGDSSILTVTGLSTEIWTPGNLNTDSIVVTPSGSTTYFVSGLDSNSCPHSDSVSVGLYPVPTVTATADPSAVCPGGTAVLTATGLVSYVWRPASGSASVVSVAPTSSTVYTVTGFDANGCPGIDTVGIEVYNQPSVPTISRSGNTLVSSPASSYQWYRNDTLIAGSTNQTYAVTVAGSYTVEVSNASGCTNTSLPSSISLGIADIADDSRVTIYPNPAYNEIHINVLSAGSYQITIVDETGRELLSSYSDKNESLMDISHLSSGPYLIQIKGDAINAVKKLVKE